MDRIKQHCFIYSFFNYNKRPIIKILIFNKAYRLQNYENIYRE